MRKMTAAILIAASSLVVATPAFADRGHGHGGDVAGALIGGAVIGAVIGSSASRGPVVVERGPRYYAPPPPAAGCFDPYAGVYVPCYAPPPPPRYRYAPPPPRYYGPPPRYYRGW